ncbi:MAG: tRNA pseudouridine(13) synthase TruD [Polyangiaceae bacterium]
MTPEIAPLEPAVPFSHLEPTGGRLGAKAEDFVVDEVLDRQLEGSGEHRLVRIEKIECTTRDAILQIAKAAGIRDRDIGSAGLKDKHAVCTQWLSLPARSAPPAEWPTLRGIRVLEHDLDRTKLRTGQLRGNRFRLRLVEVGPDALSRAQAVADALQTEGLLNLFGVQRFGAGGANLGRALEWVKNGAKRRVSRFEAKFFPSVVQAEVFNRYALARQARGLDRLMPGEVVRLAGVRSMFVVEDPDRELGRLKERDIFLTGPILGPKTRQAEAEAQTLEQEICAQLDLDADARATLARLAPGTRRDLIVFPESLRVEAPLAGELILDFFLPAGSYATEVLRAFTHQPFFANRGHERDDASAADP